MASNQQQFHQLHKFFVLNMLCALLTLIDYSSVFFSHVHCHLLKLFSVDTESVSFAKEVKIRILDFALTIFIVSIL